MVLWENSQQVFTNAVNRFGIPISIQNKLVTFSGGEYDEGVWAASGTELSGSAMFMPVSLTAGGREAQFLQEGLITLEDMKAYVPSGLEVNEKADVVIDGGSYNVVKTFVFPNDTNIVYTHVFLRTKK